MYDSLEYLASSPNIIFYVFWNQKRGVFQPKVWATQQQQKQQQQQQHIIKQLVGVCEANLTTFCSNLHTQAEGSLISLEIASFCALRVF